MVIYKKKGVLVAIYLIHTGSYNLVTIKLQLLMLILMIANGGTQLHQIIIKRNTWLLW